MARSTLRPLSLRRLDGNADPRAFGAGRSVESFGGGAGPEAYGAGLRIPTANAVGYGAGTGEALRVAGAVAGQAAEVALRIDRQDSILRGRRNALSAGVEYDKRFMERKAGAPADAKDFTKSTMEDFDTFRQQKLEGLEGVERDIVENELLQLEGSIYKQAVGFETERKFETRKSEVGSLLDIARNAVFSRPQDLGRVREGIVGDIAATDLPQFAKDTLTKTATAALAESYFSAEVQRDPYATKARLEAGDPADLQGLEFDSRTQLLNKADAEIRGIEAEKRRQEAEARAAQREREAEARAARAEAQYAARFTYEDEVAAAERGEVANPNAMKIITAAFGDKAGPMVDSITRAREAAGYARQFSTMTADEIAGAIGSMAPSGDGYKGEAATQEQLAQVASKVLTERQTKPSEAVVKAYPGIAQLLAADDPQLVAQGLRQSAQVQADVFGLTPDKVQVVPPGLADRLVSGFKDAKTADERIGMLARYTTALGDDKLAGKVLGDLERKGLPPGARLALERVAEGDITGAREIVAGLSTDPKDLPKLAETKTADVAAAVDSRMADTGPAGLSTRLANLSRQPGLFARSSAERAEMIRLTTQYTAAGDDVETAAAKAEKTLFGDVAVAGDDDLGYVRAPAGVDPGDLSSGMARLRQSIDLSYLAPQFGEPADGAAAGAQGAAKRDFDRWAQSIRDGGIFTDAEGGYALMSPEGRFIPDPKNPTKPRIFTPQEVAAMAGPGPAPMPPPAPANANPRLGVPGELPADPWAQMQPMGPKP